jgi:hypothetical protein
MPFLGQSAVDHFQGEAKHARGVCRWQPSSPASMEQPRMEGPNPILALVHALHAKELPPSHSSGGGPRGGMPHGWGQLRVGATYGA